jgi:hypothetical protein
MKKKVIGREAKENKEGKDNSGQALYLLAAHAPPSLAARS